MKLRKLTLLFLRTPRLSICRVKRLSAAMLHRFRCLLTELVGIVSPLDGLLYICNANTVSAKCLSAKHALRECRMAKRVNDVSIKRTFQASSKSDGRMTVTLGDQIGPNLQL